MFWQLANFPQDTEGSSHSLMSGTGHRVASESHEFPQGREPSFQPDATMGAGQNSDPAWHFGSWAELEPDAPESLVTYVVISAL